MAGSLTAPFPSPTTAGSAGTLGIDCGIELYYLTLFVFTLLLTHANFYNASSRSRARPAIALTSI